ncbi:unnamed protein product [Spodoptera littoralis]|uniref:PHD finger protein 12 n=1 Tax=Spodoptera littoralis TaxID=7109 RepID=A0A9P0I6Y0_SPOLI|nr:unnamed protein product [Spodoptera littoralis]CAH1641328.1 unnamed protein product [Spodoptera littoralis]
MSNVGYDLDTSGGLMPLIRALIKPPDEDVSTQKPKKPQHPYYKRPGKGHNHDSCDACGEGGDLICCDRCPASFHLGCYDPPLDENDIPAGLWLCKECRAADENKPASSRSSRAQSPVDNKSDTEKKSGLRNRSNSKKAKDDEIEIKQEVEKELSPMEILVKAAKIMNPKQFELPREMRIPCIFPGTDKDPGKNGNSSLVTVDAWGCVPLPAKACFVCQATCKHAPLLQCDYCPLLFHQDCLDPPLTALPTGRWMCPNHVEQYIDWKLVNSISATERVALWEKFSGPVDQQAVKVDFIRRARKVRPAFRMKVPVSLRGRVVVPAMVRHHYCHPPPLLPSRRDQAFDDSESLNLPILKLPTLPTVLKNLKNSGNYEASEEEEDEGPKHKICLNTSCPQYSGGRCGCEGEAPRAPPHDPHRAPRAQLHAATPQDAADDLHAISAEPVSKQPEVRSDSDSELSDSDFEYLTASVKRRKVSQSEDKSPSKRGRTDRLELRPEEDVEELLNVVDNQLKKLDERLVKLLAWQRLQQVLAGEQLSGSWRGLGAARRLARAVGGAVERARLARLGVLRAARPSELLSSADRARIARAVWGEPPAPARPPSPPSSPGHSLSAAAVRATLCAITRPDRNGVGDGLGRPIPMRLSSLSIGSDSGCDVRLDPSACRHVSRNHAVIFMDEVSRHFELINYSEWGSCVNGVLYTCDVLRAGAAGAEPEPSQEGRPAQPDLQDSELRADALRHIVRHRLAEPLRINGNLTVPLPGETSCRCGSVPSSEGAWEGSALVPHGALLQFGCQTFVFSITDALSLPEDSSEDPL